MEDSISPTELEVYNAKDEANTGEIRFVDCKIICSNIPERVSDEVDSFPTQVQEAGLDSVSPSTADIFKNCMFKPAQKAGPDGSVDGTCLQLFQEKVYSHFAGGYTYSFINCKFVERRPTLIEQVGMKIREIIGTSFQTGNGGLVEFHNSNVKLKHIPVMVETARKLSLKRSSIKRKSKSER